MKYVLFGVCSFLYIGFPSDTHTVFAATIIEGTITENTTWTAAASPYIINSKLTVAQGTILTLQAGTVVKLQSENGITVNGSLYVEGTAAEPVYFTSLRDDSVGGDSNGNGSNTAPAAGDWHGITFNLESTGILDYAIIRYAGFGYSSVVPQISSVHNLGGNIRIRNSEFSKSSTCAVGQTAGSVAIEHSSMHHMFCGVVAIGGDIHASDSAFQNTSVSFFANNLKNIELINNFFENNDINPEITLTRVKSFVHSGNRVLGTRGSGNGLLIRGTITSDMTLTKDDAPYLVTAGSGFFGAAGMQMLKENSLFIKATSTLSIEPGVIIKFIGAGKISIDGTLRVLGTSDAPVYFTSIKDDSIGGDSNADGSTTLPARGNWNHVQFNARSKGELRHTIMRYGGRHISTGSLANLNNNGGDVSLNYSELSLSESYGIRHNAGTTTIGQSFIHDNPQYGIINTSLSNSSKVHAQNNYWNSSSGPKHISNPEGQGDRVSDNVLFTPWKTVNCFVNCHSSVLFLPGIQASLLYKDTLLGEDQVWPPNAFNNEDVQDLRMSAAGVSENDIYTRDIINTSIGVGSVYGGLINFMDQLKTDDLIAGWKPYAYDWRYSVTDVVKNGTQYEEGMRSAINELTQLASTSRTGKVTIVGHSNGGLLAKAIIRELEAKGKASLVDKVVLVASPQLGTPKAIGTILHGYDQTDKIGGIIINAQNAREVINNLPGAYGLLPSAKYFEGLTEPIVTFADGGVTSPYRSVYGNAITSYANYVSFVRGADSLPRDIDGKVSTPARANTTMLNEGLAMHDVKLDTWVAPSGIEVIEIIGTGLPTMKAVEYREVVEEVCGIVCANVATLKPYAVLTHYGDETVVQRSAEGYGGEKDKYFVNLVEIKRIFPDTKFKHYNITDAPPLQNLVKELLLSTTTKTNQFISTAHTEFFDQYDVEIIDSPVRLLATDTAGNETGVVIEGGVRLIKEEIPGSQYFEFGDTKYFVVPKGTNRTITLFGEDYGGYTLTTAELTSSDTQIVKTELKNASTTPAMVALYSNTGGQYSSITTDLDGDGLKDRETTIDGVVIEDETEVTYTTLLEAIQNLSSTRGHVEALVQQVTQAQKHSLHILRTKGTLKSEMQNLNNASRLVKSYIDKKYLSEVEGLELLGMLQVLKDKQ